MTAQQSERIDDRTRGSGRRYGPATVFAGLAGLAYVGAAIWGFVETGFSDWTNQTGVELLWFQVNPLHNLVHLVIGAGLLAGAALSEGAARIVTTLVALVYTVVGVAGFLVTGGGGDVLPALAEDWDVLALNTADNWLHLGTAALGLLVVIASDRRRVVRGA